MTSMILLREWLRLQALHQRELLAAASRPRAQGEGSEGELGPACPLISAPVMLLPLPMFTGDTVFENGCRQTRIKSIMLKVIKGRKIVSEERGKELGYLS